MPSIYLQTLSSPTSNSLELGACSEFIKCRTSISAHRAASLPAILAQVGHGVGRIIQFCTCLFRSVICVPGVPLTVNVVRDRHRLLRRFLRWGLYRGIRWFACRRLRCPISTITYNFRACSKTTEGGVRDTAGCAAKFLAGSWAFVGYKKHGIIQIRAGLTSGQSAWPGADILALDSRGTLRVSARRLGKILRMQAYVTEWMRNPRPLSRAGWMIGKVVPFLMAL